MTDPINSEPSDTDRSPAESALDKTAEDASKSPELLGVEVNSEQQDAIADDDDLPEWEPLTPELVEDEAIRGDFMLRWCVILLAFLLGCRAVSETMTLVRIRSGEQIVENGMWPRVFDTFSYTATDRIWTNPAWLFDVVLSSVHSVAGPFGLTLLTAVIAAATFYLIAGIRRAELPTWWTSICAAIALLAVHWQFTALPQIVTLLGVAWTLNGLYRWSENGNSAVLKCLVVSLAVWSNLDDRAFVGWLLIAAFTVGSLVRDRQGFRTHHADAATRDLLKATLAGFVALMINPFGWNTVLMPFQMFGVELASRLSYAGSITSLDEFKLLSIADGRVWSTKPHFVMAAAVVGVLTIVTGVMNLRRLDLGLTFAALVAVGLTFFALEELPTAVLVLCVLASLNGQDWYRSNCRIDYSVATLEVLWSRAGRAITVLSLAAVAWLAISGRLTGPHDKRGQFGFSDRLATKIAGTAEDLTDTFDGRIFTFRLDHGDLLIWNRTPCFADSRVRLYLDGEEDLLDLHNRTRYALRLRPAGVAPPDATIGTSNPDDEAGSPAEIAARSAFALFQQPDVWKSSFDRFNVSLSAPRLWGTIPNYDSYFDLTVSREWGLIRLGSSLALFARLDKANEKLQQFFDERHGNLSFAAIAFKECRKIETELERVDWPRPKTDYQKFISLPEPVESNAASRAQHQLAHLNAGMSGVIPVTHDDAFGLAILAIRDANAALANDVSNVSALQSLSSAYEAIASIEQMIIPQSNLTGPMLQRHYQRLYALRQILILQPDDLETLSSLVDIHLNAQQWDLALDAAKRAMDIIRNLSVADAGTLGLARRIKSVTEELETRSAAMNQQVEIMLAADNSNRLQIAASLHHEGFLLRALEVLDEDRIGLSNNSLALMERALLLCETGRLEEADVQFADTEALVSSPQMDLMWILQGAWIQMARGDYDAAIQRCQQRVNEIERGSAEAMISLFPFVQPNPAFSGDNNIWPVTLTTASSAQLIQLRSTLTQLRWTIATARLESGQCAEAAEVLQQLIDLDPETPMRSGVGFLLRVITDRIIPEEPESERVPILFENGPEDPSAEPG